MSCTAQILLRYVARLLLWTLVCNVCMNPLPLLVHDVGCHSTLAYSCWQSSADSEIADTILRMKIQRRRGLGISAVMLHHS